MRSLVMATATAPTVPTAAAEPSAAPPKPEPSGPLARILTPVEPARPTKPLGSTAAMGDVSDGSTKTGTDAPAKDAAAKAAGQEGAVSALVRALAARIGRGGTSIKRTHTVQETRVSGSTTNTTNRGDRSAKSNRDAKLADLNSKQQHGKSNRDAKTASTRAAKTDAATKANRDTRQAGTRTADTKTAKADTATTTSASKPDARPVKATVPKSTAPGSGTGGGAAKTLGPKPAGTARPDGPGMVKPSAEKKPDPKGLNAKTAAAKPASSTPTAPAKAAAAPAATPAAAATAPAAAPKQRTRTAREAGYRDGTRVAAVTGQARAYRDGAVDGWDDRTAADKAEGKTMSDTRARNATRPQEKAAPKMQPASGSTVDLAKKDTAPAAVPAQVTAVGAKAVEFVADGAAHTMSRGEVRTLKAFERRLADKQKTLGKVKETSKGTRVLAVELAVRAQRLAEDAKAVKGGERLVRVLLRLAERSQALRHRAEEIEKNAGRGTEAVKVLSANAETRHGGIYRAVVDSPLTAPAEREFYQDKQGG